MRKRASSIILTLLFAFFASTTAFAKEIDTKYDVALNKSWNIELNMDVDSSTVNENNVFITNSSGNKIDCKVSLSSIGKSHIITISPNSNYASGGKYTLHVKGLKSPSGVSLKEPVTMGFITIENKDEKKIFRSSEYFKKDYVEIEIVDNREIKFEGRSDLDKTAWLLYIEGEKDLQEFGNVKPDGTYEGTLSINNKLSDGDYLLSLYFKAENDTYYMGYYLGIPIKCESGEVFFEKSPVYENNYIKYTDNSKVNPNMFLNIYVEDENERKVIKSLAENIVSGASSNYDKLLKINNWVAENIYYDWDSYLSGIYPRTDAYGTLINRKSVCQGYAELTDALLKSVGIPSRVVTGCAINVGYENWDSIDSTFPNHAWNEAFVDGRWVIVDTTWNSGNKYENGEFKKSKMKYRYFDPALEEFSYDHKIISSY